MSDRRKTSGGGGGGAAPLTGGAGGGGGASSAVTGAATRGAPAPRTITVNQGPQASPFVHNGVTTSKYNLVTFLPKNLFEQFRRVANLYFLVIAILQLIPLGLSPISPITSILPLGFVLGVTAIKEAIEDVRRHRSDRETNNKQAVVVRDGREEPVAWSAIQVGDILKVEKDSNFPCDLLLLGSSDAAGTCYIETKNLDGETNYKDRQALPDTRAVGPGELDARYISSLRGTIDCEGPNNSLYTFNGYLTLDGAPGKVSLGVRQILLRGSQLRNTKWIFGLVIYTGHDTKLMQNATEPPSKRSNLEIVMNRQIFSIFGFLGAVCALCAVMNGLIQKKSLDNRPYLMLDQGDDAGRQKPAISGTLAFFTFVILFNTMIPISLYVSMELVKVVQAYLMLVDDDMKNNKADGSESSCVPRTSNLNEELGQVQYIFSDKTGTLTDNRMEFLKCSVDGVEYGTGITEIARAAAKRQGKSLPPDPPGHRKDLKPGELNFDDKRLSRDLAGRNARAEALRTFLNMLAVCHTVIPEVGPGGKLIYQAASPDEFALVHAARHLGFEFKERDIDSVTVTEYAGQRNQRDVRWEILNVLEFNSTRKRMSVVARSSVDGRIVLMCKGADSVIYERLNPRGDAKFAEITEAHLEKFAQDGLRTLCFAYAELDPREYKRWDATFREASIKLEGREEALDAAAERIEKNLTLVGASAIEDKLQEGVPKTIETLARAGIKIWVLTGDKQETAINIGFACSLLHTAMHVVIVNERSKEAVQDRIRKEIRAYNERPAGSSRPDLGFVIDGASLTHALDPDVEPDTLALSTMCKAVICCRVSPIQKAQVVSMVRDNLSQITLAVGDGANDVSMIQAAHLGIGIEGEEGTQAVRSSDYSIGQFRFLAQLLLIHGRWSYQRVAVLILYSFYKNMAFSLTQFWFATQSLFTGQTMFESAFIAIYNVTFTSMPIMMIAVFDQDVSARAVHAFPFLYAPGQEKRSFNTSLFWLWLLTGVYHSVIFFWSVFFMFRTGILNGDGRDAGLWSLGTFAYSCVVVTVNLKVALHTSYWTFYNHFFTWGSVAFWFIFVAVYANFEGIVPDAYGVSLRLFGTPVYWCGLAIVPVICLLPDYIAKYLARNYAHQPVHIVKEIEKFGDLERSAAAFAAATEPAMVPMEAGGGLGGGGGGGGGRGGGRGGRFADPDDEYTYEYESYSYYTYEYSSD
jgi:phospholipid-transporting ATPase